MKDFFCTREQVNIKGLALIRSAGMSTGNGCGRIRELKNSGK